MPEETQLIAPCGMNCGICLAYLREKRNCSGCHGDDSNKPPTILNCIIRNCEMIKTSQSGFCFECVKYPCKRLKQLDKRYRTKYVMSMIENLGSIKGIGLSAFIENEKERWHCVKCGGVICVHRGYCYNCGERAN
ncbi:DUF3795 domain-containing protein [Chloroflexota bacterium]